MTSASDRDDLPFGSGADVSDLMGLGLRGEAAEEFVADAERFAVPPPEALAGRFPALEILERIGSGGMGCVYKARQTHLDRIVALKILPAELGGDPKFTERFTREAQSLARLVHPNIVTVHDFGVADGMYFLLMEYMDGMSLRELMNVEEPGSIDVTDIMTQVCAALQYAHDNGIVHRDIKPENILFDCRGHLKIADFGLVKLASAATRDVSLTGSRQAMGTLHYMAPEQWQDPHAVDHRADLYALGVMLYELLTGRLPLGHFDPPSLLATVDPRVDDVVMIAMQSNPEQRFQRADDLAAALRALDGLTGTLTRQRPADDGTFTRFQKVGGRVQRFAAKVAGHAATPSNRFPVLTLLWFLAIGGLTVGKWVSGLGIRPKEELGLRSVIPGMPIAIPNYIPLMLAFFILALRLIPGRRGVRGELLTLLLSAGGVAHVVVFYAAWDGAFESPSIIGHPYTVTIVPAVVGVLFAVCFLEQLWSLFTRLCGWIGDGARSLPWRSWVDGLNQQVARAAQATRASGGASNSVFAREKQMWCRLRKRFERRWRDRTGRGGAAKEQPAKDNSGEGPDEGMGMS